MVNLYPRNRLPTAQKKQIRKDYLLAQAALKLEKRQTADDAANEDVELQQSPRGRSGQSQEEIDREIAAAALEREVYEKRRRYKERDLGL